MVGLWLVRYLSKGQNKTKVGLKDGVLAGGQPLVQGQNKTKVGLKEYYNVVVGTNSDGQNKTKVGLKASEGGCAALQSSQSE